MLYVEAFTVLFANTTPEIDDEKPVPVNNEPAIPAPPETTKAPVVVDDELSVELNVTFPVEAPNEIVVAAPKAFIVVAFVLKTANVVSPVVTPVPNEG